MDDELLATMAGLFSAGRPSRAEDVANYLRYGALAALFALASLDEKPSISMVVRPVINELYLAFMILPFVMALGCFALLLVLLHYKSERGLAEVPTNAYEYMIFGVENEYIIQPRQPTGDDDKFPTTPTTLLLKYRGGNPNGKKEQDKVSSGGTLSIVECVPEDMVC